MYTYFDTRLDFIASVVFTQSDPITIITRNESFVDFMNVVLLVESDRTQERVSRHPRRVVNRRGCYGTIGGPELEEDVTVPRRDLGFEEGVTAPEEESGTRRGCYGTQGGVRTRVVSRNGRGGLRS